MSIQQVNSPVNSTAVAESSAPVVRVNTEVSTIKPAIAAAANKAQEGPVVDIAHLKNVVDQINKTIQSFSNNLQFSVEQLQGLHVVKIVDNETQKVIRQIPNQETLDIAKRLDELQGLLFQYKA